MGEQWFGGEMEHAQERRSSDETEVLENAEDDGDQEDGDQDLADGEAR